MKYAHLLASFYFEPWNLRPDYHANFGRILQAHMTGQPAAEQIYARQPPAPISAASSNRPIVGPVDFYGNPYVPQMEVAGEVAMIPIYGALGKRLQMIDLLCGGCDYDHIAQFIDMAAYDPAISTVILDIDSPGGSCRGLPELAAKVLELSEKKDTATITDGLCCSAGFYLASCTDQIYATPSASVGNIGTVLAACDNSREWEMKGWRLELFASGALKGAGFDGKAWTQTERDFFQGWMQKKFHEFKSVVQATRPQVPEEAFDGRWLDGDIAEGFGFTDGVVQSKTDFLAEVIHAGSLK